MYETLYSESRSLTIPPRIYEKPSNEDNRLTVPPQIYEIPSSENSARMIPPQIYERPNCENDNLKTPPRIYERARCERSSLNTPPVLYEITAWERSGSKASNAERNSQQTLSCVQEKQAVRRPLVSPKALAAEALTLAAGLGGALALRQQYKRAQQQRSIQADFQRLHHEEARHKAAVLGAGVGLTAGAVALQQRHRIAKFLHRKRMSTDAHDAGEPPSHVPLKRQEDL